MVGVVYFNNDACYRCTLGRFHVHQYSFRPYCLLPLHHVFSHYLCVVSCHWCRSHYHLDASYFQTSETESSWINLHVKRPHGPNPCQQSFNPTTDLCRFCVRLSHTSSSSRNFYIPWSFWYRSHILHQTLLAYLTAKLTSYFPPSMIPMGFFSLVKLSGTLLTQHSYIPKSWWCVITTATTFMIIPFPPGMPSPSLQPTSNLLKSSSNPDYKSS